jgi:prevent-host-death family protein
VRARRQDSTTCSTIEGVETTARELNQHTAQVLARVEAGETFTVTKNGRPLAILRPYSAEDPAAYPFRTDPMGWDDSVPTFRGAADFSERAEDLMAGFGGDE